MYVIIMCSEAPLPQYLNCRTVSRSALLEEFWLCVSHWVGHHLCFLS